MFQTPEELRNFRQLSQVPAVTKTIRSTLLDFPNGKAPEPIHDDDVVQVMDVSQREFIELKKRTQGTTILVWFGGKSRYAWVPRSANPESRPASSAEAPPATKVPPTQTLITENAPSNTTSADSQQQHAPPQQPAQASSEVASSPKLADLEPEATSSPVVEDGAQQYPVDGTDPSTGAAVAEAGGGGGTAQEKVDREEGDAMLVGEDSTTAAAAAEIV
ncbi:hypothetical protein C8A05DRAFT_38349, partial [Staphylotrichum tortipilum]